MNRIEYEKDRRENCQSPISSDPVVDTGTGEQQIDCREQVGRHMIGIGIISKDRSSTKLKTT